jgi:hemolysin activation/secretion protein
VIFGEAYAQNGLNFGSPAEQLERDRGADERQQQFELNRQNNQPPDSDDISPPKRDLNQQDETCIHVETVLVSGVTLLNKIDIDKTLVEFEDQCIGVTTLNHILEKITYLYINDGYITSRAYLPEQNLADGSLEIIVIEGHLDSIIMDGDQESHESQINAAFPNLVGNPVNLRNIEQGLDQLNRLQSNNAEISIEAGRDLGSSILNVSRNKSKTWYGNIEFDNLGSRSTGKYQTKLNLGLDDLFGLNDKLNFSYQRSMSRNPFYIDDVPKSDTYFGSISVPYGYWTFSLNGSLSEYNTQIKGNFSNIDASGNSQSIDTSTSYVLHRDQTSITSLSGKLKRKNSENFLLGSLIEVSSRSLSIATLEIVHSRQLLGGQLVSTAGYHQGLNILDAYDDNEAPPESPKGQFRNMTGYLSYFRPIRVGDKTMTYNGQISGQYAPDSLFGTEQVSYGGYSTVRGLRESVVFGNRGILMRNELAFQLPQSKNRHFVKTFGTFEHFLAIDHGDIYKQHAIGIDGGDLTGAGVGFRNRGGKLGIDIAWMDIIGSSRNLDNSLSRSGLIYAKLKFFF